MYKLSGIIRPVLGLQSF